MTEEVVILHEANCSSLSNQSTITYQIGSRDGTIHIRLTGNSGNGNFNGYWLPVPEILVMLNDKDSPFTWHALQPLFERKSANSSAFLLAALKNEDLIHQSEKEPRRYECCDPKPFMAKVQALTAPREKPKPKKKGGSKEPPPVIEPPAEPVNDPPAEPQTTITATA